MTTLSLKARQIMVFVGIIALVLPLVFLSIEQAFRQSKVHALEQQLEANLYAIIGEIDMDAQIPIVAGGFLPPVLNQSDSGTIALLEDNGQMSWYSDSSLNQKPQLKAIAIENGQSKFQFQAPYWQYSYALFYDNDYGTHNFVIHV